MKIGIGSDHGGFEMKQKIKDLLADREGVEVTDFGTYSPESVDYTDFAVEVARRVSDGTLEQGILVCTTGVGMSMAANKFPRVRAAQVFTPDILQWCPRHDGLAHDSNSMDGFVDLAQKTPAGEGRRNRQYCLTVVFDKADNVAR